MKESNEETTWLYERTYDTFIPPTEPFDSEDEMYGINYVFKPEPKRRSFAKRAIRWFFDALGWLLERGWIK